MTRRQFADSALCIRREGSPLPYIREIMSNSRRGVLQLCTLHSFLPLSVTFGATSVSSKPLSVTRFAPATSPNVRGYLALFILKYVFKVFEGYEGGQGGERVTFFKKSPFLPLLKPSSKQSHACRKAGGFSFLVPDTGLNFTDVSATHHEHTESALTDTAADSEGKLVIKKHCMER